MDIEIKFSCWNNFIDVLPDVYINKIYWPEYISCMSFAITYDNEYIEYTEICCFPKIVLCFNKLW